MSWHDIGLGLLALAALCGLVWLFNVLYLNDKDKK